MNNKRGRCETIAAPSFTFCNVLARRRPGQLRKLSVNFFLCSLHHIRAPFSIYPVFPIDVKFNEEFVFAKVLRGIKETILFPAVRIRLRLRAGVCTPRSLTVMEDAMKHTIVPWDHFVIPRKFDEVLPSLNGCTVLRGPPLFLLHEPLISRFAQLPFQRFSSQGWSCPPTSKALSLKDLY